MDILTEGTIDYLPKKKRDRILYYAGFVLLLICYLIGNRFTIVAAKSDNALLFFGNNVPFSIFTGVFSSLSNICIFFLVVFYGKPGFTTSLAVLMMQFSGMIMSFSQAHTTAAIPGVFTNVLTLIAIVLMYHSNKTVKRYQVKEFEHLKQQQMFSQKLFEQTATALVNAIDAKDTYSHGHSLRVAEYSERIARKMGKSDEECYKIFYSALLHDVGKIGIDDTIINKKGGLEPYEYNMIKQHPVIGNEILSSITEYPYLSIGAHYHHERYDGKGYPDRLKGDDIPEIARIISVADAYDAMSSNRSYRNAIPQQLIREEIVKGAGVQFDPGMAEIMLHLIDEDREYMMKERSIIPDAAGKSGLRCESFRSEISEGIVLTPYLTKVNLTYSPEKENEGAVSKAALVVFDSIDGRVHNEEKAISDFHYYEYCEIDFDGNVINKGARDIVTEVKNDESSAEIIQDPDSIVYEIEAVKCRDHALIKINDGNECKSFIIALPDATRYVYIGLTGANCYIGDVDIAKDDTPVSADYIPRIADSISYIDGPEGDIPNVQIDSALTASSEGIPVKDGMQISFHSKSLPTARLIWHCPYIKLYTSPDGRQSGEGYNELALIRIDGENRDDDGKVTNRILVNKTEAFEGWDAWKKSNMDGFDCTVTFERKDSVIITGTENFGLAVRNITTIKTDVKEVYAALTGDQVALTDIRIR